MHFRASLRGVVYYRLATAFLRCAHQMYTCNGMWQYSRRWRGVEPSSVNLPKNQHGVENWSLDCQKGVGGVVVGELSNCTSVVFRWEWPADIKNNIVLFSNPTGGLTNSDLEMAGLLILWLVLKGVCPSLREKCVTLFSDNSPTVSWVTRLASRKSLVAEHLVQALALRLKTMHACPLTPLHIEGKRNAIADVPSRSFGSNPAWACATSSDLLNLFNSRFPFPQQKSWTVYHPNCDVVMRVISALRMKPFVLDNWRRLPTRGRCVGEIGAPKSNTWEWIRIYNKSHTPSESDASQDLQPEQEQVSTDTDDKSKVAWSLALSRPLARRSLWPEMKTLPRY